MKKSNFFAVAAAVLAGLAVVLLAAILAVSGTSRGTGAYSARDDVSRLGKAEPSAETGYTQVLNHELVPMEADIVPPMLGGRRKGETGHYVYFCDAALIYPDWRLDGLRDSFDTASLRTADPEVIACCRELSGGKPRRYIYFAALGGEPSGGWLLSYLEDGTGLPNSANVLAVYRREDVSETPRALRGLDELRTAAEK